VLLLPYGKVLFAIESPVIIKIFDFDFLLVLFQVSLEMPLGEFYKESDNVIVEILGVPLKNTAHIKGVSFEAVVLRIIDEDFCHLCELLIQDISLKGFRPQRRATFGRTVDGEMNTGVLETGPEDIVFNVVQGNDISVDTSNILFPWALEQAAEVLDRPKAGVGAQDQFDCPGIVGVDVKGKRLVGRKLLCVGLLQDFEILIQFVLLTLETLIVNLSVLYIFLK
jgi:hypothetical protein